MKEKGCRFYIRRTIHNSQFSCRRRRKILQHKDGVLEWLLLLLFALCTYNVSSKSEVVGAGRWVWWMELNDAV